MPTYSGWNRDTDVNTGGAIGWGDQQWGAIGVTQSVSLDALTASTEDVASVTGDANQTLDSQVATWQPLGQPELKFQYNVHGLLLSIPLHR